MINSIIDTYTIVKECIAESAHYRLDWLNKLILHHECCSTFPRKIYELNEECDVIDVDGNEVAYCICRNTDNCNVCFTHIHVQPSIPCKSTTFFRKIQLLISSQRLKMCVCLLLIRLLIVHDKKFRTIRNFLTKKNLPKSLHHLKSQVHPQLPQ